MARFRKPTFIDKPFTVCSDEAASIMALSTEHGTPVMSASSLSYCDPLADSLRLEGDSILGADFTGPMPIEPTQGGVFWYSVHLVEALYESLGTGCRELHVTTSEDHDVAVGLWEDGRIGSARGFCTDNYYFRVVIHRSSGEVWLDLDRKLRGKADCC